MSTILVWYAAVTVVLAAVLLLVIVVQSAAARLRRPQRAVTVLPVPYATAPVQAEPMSPPITSALAPSLSRAS